ncbi:MAG: PASTA domain-containing protein [Thermoleophilia bacterium]|jgi:serine/threonine-protein kinase|nr:PASTA domain-containing protein [Thermoleophilia bacterium]
MASGSGFGPDIEQRFTLGESIRRDDKLLSCHAADSRGRDVVLTFVTPSDPQGFLDQAERLAGVVHPVVTPVLDWGETDGRCFLARQDVEGTPLNEVIAERDKVPWEEAVGWATEVAAGLSALHALGAVHGGVSPQAVIVTPDDSVRLVDAGLARASWPADLTALDPPRAAYYKTPEEVLARELSPASDVYALGLVLYHLVTGAPPFEGRTALEVAERQMGADPELPSRLVPGLPEGLERVIIHALAKQPEDRYADAGLMRKDLERVAKKLPVVAPPVPGSEPVPEPAKLASDAPIAATPAVERHRFAAWALGTAIAAALLIVALLWSFGAFGDKVAVPDLSGMNETQARTALADAGLELGEVSLEAAPVGTILGTVFSQDPPAGDEVGVGSRVDVRIASSTTTVPSASPSPGTVETPGTTIVPEAATAIAPTVVGLSQADAEQTITTAGLLLDETLSVYHPTVAGGVVAGQVPSPGQAMAPGGAMAIAVSMGPAPAGANVLTVPGLLGTSGTEASTDLQGLGYVVVIWELAADGRPVGAVFGQCPSAGSQVTPGSMIILLVSSGSAPTTASPTP